MIRLSVVGVDVPLLLFNLLSVERLTQVDRAKIVSVHQIAVEFVADLSRAAGNFRG